MADDLKPKPPASSSAGSQAASPPVLGGAFGARARAADQEPAHRFRFGFAYLVLAAALGAAVGTFVLLLGRPDDKPVPWSSWRPSGSGAFQIPEIVEHVTSRYRNANGRQLLVAIARPPSIVDGENFIPVSGVARRAPVVRSQSDLAFTPLDNSVMFLLCGDGSQRCSLSGEPSNARGQLVRREALELALYTFKYVGDVESILTFMPPASGTTSSTALFYRRSDLAAQLDRPLGQTLPPRPVVRTLDLGLMERTIVDRLTLPHLFRTEPTQAQDGSVLLMLEPVALNS
jgi:hypothetical protein